MTRTASLGGGIVMLLLSLVCFLGRFHWLPEVWRTGPGGVVRWALAWVLLAGGAYLLGRALWPQPLEHEAERDVDTVDPFHGPREH